MKHLHKLFVAAHLLVIALFFACALGLVVLAAGELWRALAPGTGLDVRARFDVLLDCIGILTIALVALELGQKIFEEECSATSRSADPRACAGSCPVSWW